MSCCMQKGWLYLAIKAILIGWLLLFPSVPYNAGTHLHPRWLPAETLSPQRSGFHPLRALLLLVWKLCLLIVTLPLARHHGIPCNWNHRV